MAEFCLKCWNELHGTADPPQKYIISKYVDFCEGCAQWTNVIVMERKYYYRRRLRYFLLPFRILYKIGFILFRLLFLPYFIYQYFKEKK